jgi:outer membrane protein OmpA-like peptidoglycan-associated protein
MARKSHDFEAMQRMLDLVPQDWGEFSWSKLASGVSNPTSQVSAASKRMVSALFGTTSDTVAHLIGREVEVAPETAAAMLGMAAPMSLSFLRKRIETGGLSLDALSATLHKESPTIRSALPAGLCDVLWRSEPAAATAAGAVYQPVKDQKSGVAWIGVLGIALVAIGSLWIWSHIHRGGIAMGTTATGAANRMAGESGTPGKVVENGLRRGLEHPSNETGSKLLGTLGANDASGRPSWANFDRLRFDPGSATLPANSSDQLDQIATTLKDRPNLRLMIAGHTDSLGSAAQNLRLSRLRADQVKNALVARAISPERIVTHGRAEQDAVGDNSTDEGRAMNRCVSMRVTQY